MSFKSNMYTLYVAMYICILYTLLCINILYVSVRVSFIGGYNYLLLFMGYLISTANGLSPRHKQCIPADIMPTT